MLDVIQTDLPGQSTYDGGVFPYAVVNRTAGATVDDTAEWIGANRAALLKRSVAHGAVFFRGFPIRTATDFDRFIAAFDLPYFRYEESLSNAVRVVKTDRVFTANEAPPSVSIYLHHEMAQTPIYPSRLFFFCEHAAETGGATPLCRSDVLWAKLSRECPQFARDCEQKGLKYTNVMPAANDAASGMGRSWQSTLAAETQAEAERRLRQLNYSWEWLPDGCLKATTPVLPAVRMLPDGRVSFFNQLIAAFKGWKDERNDPAKAITFGDGTPLDRTGVDTAVRLGDELSFDTPWQTGDVVLVDNYVTMHGRRTFTGTRKVLASLIAAEG